MPYIESLESVLHVPNPTPTLNLTGIGGGPAPGLTAPMSMGRRGGLRPPGTTMLRAVKPQSRVIVYRRLGREKKEKKIKKKKERKKKRKKRARFGIRTRRLLRGSRNPEHPPPAPVRVSYRVTLEIDQLSQPFNPRNNALRMIILVSVRIKALRIRKSSHCGLESRVEIFRT